MALRLLDDQERSEVAAAIAHAESRCQGEIVYCEVPRSGDYARYLSLPALLFVVAAASALHLLFPHVPALWLLAGQVPMAVLLWWFMHRPRVALLLVPNEIEQEAVRQRARELFATHALYETKHRAAVLIFMSAFERRVEILSDRGLEGIISAETWQAHVATLVGSIKRGRTAEGVCQVVKQVADVMAGQWGPPTGASAAEKLPDML